MNEDIMEAQTLYSSIFESLLLFQSFIISIRRLSSWPKEKKKK